MAHILLIDDSPLQLRVREAVLRDAGFHVSVATTAEGALALLRTRGVAIQTVVTDHIMPDVSGPELVRAIREIRPELPIIVITGQPDAESQYEGLDVQFRLKPVQPPELIALVRAYAGDAAAWFILRNRD